MKKIYPGKNPLGDPSAWVPANAPANDRILKHGDTIAWYNTDSKKVYDCAYGDCTQQGFPPDSNNWGSIYRIYKDYAGGAS